MIIIYPEQLMAQLREGLSACYFLAGNEPLLIQESSNIIRAASKTHGFKEHFIVTLDVKTDWHALFANCQSLNLFTQRKTLTLNLPENGPNTSMADQLVKFAIMLHSDILLILHMSKLTKVQENSTWFKTLSTQAVLVPCQTPEQDQLPHWIANRAKTMKLSVDKAAVQLLSYCYEGNLLALTLMLECLSLLWPDGQLTLPRVEETVSNSAHFTRFHLVDAILAGNSKRALHILHQLETENTEIIILLRVLQHDLLTLLHLQRNQAKYPLCTLMDQQRIWKTRRSLFTNALQRLDASRLEGAIHILAQLELKLKQDYCQNQWLQMKTLALILCNCDFPMSFTYA